MSNIPPLPIWKGPLAPGAQTNVNIDGFGSFGTIAGAHGFNRLQEVSENGEYNLGYEYKFTMILVGTGTDVYGYGNLGCFNRGNIFGGWIIESARITPQRGAKMRVTLQWQSLGGYLPPDEWETDREDLRPHLERHPLFSTLTPPDFATVRLAFQAGTISGRVAGESLLGTTTNPGLANELYQKLLAGQEEYYLAGSRYTWSTYYLSGTTPALSAAGVTYTNPGGPAGYIIPAGTSWLRYADKCGQANYGPLGGTVKLTRTFMGAPFGCWDLDVYPPA